MKTNNVLNLIGNTPLVRLNYYSPSGKVNIYAKLEGDNPGGSIKDRIAKYLVLDGEKTGLLDRSKIIIEATSGNTGIGLAMISALRGYKFLAVMPESASIERRKLIQQYGAEILLTDGAKGTNYAIEVAHKMIKQNPKKYVMLNQFENKANVQAHFETTGLEIIEELPQITHFVTGIGTGGTIMGVGKRLKKYNPDIQVVGVEPKPNSKIQGLRNMTAYTPPIFDKNFLDDNLVIEDKDAFKLARALPLTEGLSVGISSGASLWGAIQIARKIKKGNIVTISPDRADRYVSTSLMSWLYA